MKKNKLIIITLALSWFSAAAQQTRKNYQFDIGSDVCVTPGQKIVMILQYNDVRPVIAGQPKWYVNGEPADDWAVVRVDYKLPSQTASK